METHLKGFGLENFRVFKDYTWFDFAPITILTGPNNSGKSSLNRGLKLMCDPLKINSLDLQLGGLNRVINKNSKKTDLDFTISLPYWLNNYPTMGIRTAVRLEVLRKVFDTDLQAVGDKIYRIFLNDKLLLESEMFGLSFYFDFETFYSGIKPLEKKDYDKFVTLIHQFEEVEDVLNFYSKNIDIKKGEPAQDQINDIFPEHNDPSIPQKDSIVDLYTVLKSFGLTQHQCEHLDKRILGDIYKTVEEVLAKIKYLPFRGKVARNYGLGEKNEWIGLIRKYQKFITDTNHIGRETLEELGLIYMSFIEKWIQKFNISEEIRPIIDTQFGFHSLEVNGLPLVEQGTGISQIVYILLSIALNPENSKIFLIEEPEANLHPKFQSLLADMFIDAAKTFNIQFIIETHSEYFIRKMQYLTAKKEVSPTDTNIYYFHDPENIPAGEPQVKKIEILEDGSLSSDFGSGFFDEATNWKFELMRLKNAQKN